MATGTHTYKVEGFGEFPIDMLRYDESYPASEMDAGVAHRHRDNMRRSVGVKHTCIDHKRNCAWRPTYRRWESFGWKVTDVDGVA